MKKTDINQYIGTPVVDSGNEDLKNNNVKNITSTILRTVLTIITIIFVTFCIVGISVVVYISNISNKTVDLDLRSLKLDLTSFIYVRDDSGDFVEYQPVHAGESRVWVDYDDIPKAMKDAMVAIEDKRFYEHHGVDWIRTSGAVINFVSGKDSYGGSTITQQLIKNLTKKSQVSISRKVTEIFTALGFEKRYTKDEILETYLNVVSFGSGCNGVQAAANLYFGKNISECSIAECASIAGITQNPSQYTPLIYPEKNKERQQVVINAMYDQGYINASEYSKAMKDSENMVFVGDNNDNVINDVPINNWYVETMLRDAAKDLSYALNIDEDTASYMIMHNGYKIYCAMDTNAQNIAESVFQDESVMPANQDIQAGYIMMDYDGRMLASVGQRGKKEANLLWDCANTAKRQPGSSFKPLGAYAPALEYKLYNYSSILPDKPLTGIPGTQGEWPPNWYGYYKGEMTLQKAIEISANAPAAQVVKKLTPEKSFEFVTQKLGFTSLNEAEDCTYSGMATGGSYNGVTVREMAAAFQIFGNGGVYNKPYTYFYIEDSSGKVILDNRNQESIQAISSGNSTIMRKLLQTVVTGANGTGTAGKVPGVTTFAKTGTTDNNENSWYVGGTPYAVSGIWIGHETPTEMSDYESGYAAKIWKNIMTQYVKNKEPLEFEDDPDVLVRKYCQSDGLLASGDCEDTATGYYLSENMPKASTHINNANNSISETGSSQSENSSSTYNNQTSSYTSSNYEEYSSSSSYISSKPESNTSESSSEAESNNEKPESSSKQPDVSSETISEDTSKIAESSP